MALVQARPFAGDIWAIGAQPPAFRFRQATWNASPVRRSGAARLSGCAAAAFVSGQRAWVRDGQHWKELPRLPRKAAVSLCSLDALRAAVLFEDGQLSVLQGRIWKSVAFASRPVWLGGETIPLVATERGEMFRLDVGKPARLALDARLRAFQPRALAAVGKRTWLLGTSETNATVIARLEGKQISLFDTVPPELAGHDWIGLLAADDGTLLLASSDGTVLHRNGSGAWTSETMTLQEATQPTLPAGNPPARVGKTEK